MIVLTFKGVRIFQTGLAKSLWCQRS